MAGDGASVRGTGGALIVWASHSERRPEARSALLAAAWSSAGQSSRAGWPDRGDGSCERAREDDSDYATT